MRKSRAHYTKTDRPATAPVLICLLSGFLFSINTRAQSCPYNIEFETGTFAGWTCYIGSVYATSNSNVIVLTAASGPQPTQHRMLSSALKRWVYGSYGGFPVICPNGSNYSVKLGNNSGWGHRPKDYRMNSRSHLTVTPMRLFILRGRFPGSITCPSSNQDWNWK